MKIGVVGVGNMGEALVRGLAGAQEGHALALYDVRPDRAAQVASQYRARACSEIATLLDASEVVVVAVKPQQMTAVLDELRPLGGAHHLWISIAAGVPLARLAAGLGSPRVVRVMPNTPALVGEAMSAFAVGPGVTPQDAAAVTTLLASVGRVVQVDEPALDAVTGLSGSGPAYAFLMIEALADAGVREGLPAHLALELAAQTLRGAATLALQPGAHPALLRQQVTSPAGTTAAGVAALERGGVRAALGEAVRAATMRSRELGGEPPTR
ncbi:MAG TPA: pyrroline-5-carboxylate reductase [bacterium]|jgi:pyrroline-5-carboxylate reductase